MSLQVWLPLTKDLRQQGLSNVTATNNGATFNSAGKLGGSYNCDGEILVPYDFNTTNNNYSISFWYYYPSSTGRYMPINTNSSGNFCIYFRDSQICLNTNNNGNNNRFNYTVPANIWNHYCITVNNNTWRLYVNGIDYGNSTTTLSLSFTNFTIGSSRGYGGKINDVRIYNHCLSLMEIKQISQGLILHYTLNSGNLINKLTVTTGGYLNSAGNVQGISGWCYSDYIPVLSNANYLCTGLSAGGSGTYIVLYDNTKTKTRTLLLTANQDLSITTANNETYIRLSIRQIANELDTTAKFLYIDTIEYDCSGFCNNGVKVGTLTYQSDTPKYIVSTYFNGSSAIKNSNFPFSTNQWTVAFWYKFTTAPSAFQGFLCLSRNSGADADKKIAAMPQSSYIWLKFESINYSFQSRKTNEWCHIVMTCDGINGKVYENGELKYTTGSVGTILTDCDDFVVGARANSANAATTAVYLNGNMSDVRVYATSLSADDVKSLYQNSAYIDSSGNIYGTIHE